MALTLKNRAKQWSRIWHANIGIATALTLGAIALSCPFIAHKGGDFALGKALMDIHYGKFLPKQWEWIWIDFQGLALLFLIGSGWFIHIRTRKQATEKAADDPSAPGSSVAIVWESGRPAAEAGARRLAQAAEARGLRAFAIESGRYQTTRLAQERWLICLLAGEHPTLPLTLNGEKLPRLEYALVGADAAAVVRCEALGHGFEERGARSFAATRLIAASDPAWTAEIVTHLARFTKTPKPKPASVAASEPAAVAVA